MNYKLIILVFFGLLINNCGRRLEHSIVFWHTLGGPSGDSLNDFIDKDIEFKESLDYIFPVFLKSVAINDMVWSFPFNKSVCVRKLTKRKTNIIGGNK